jgi:YjbE family integral membrane protein
MADGMSFLTDPEFWARWMGIVLIDLTLAGDNAIVIALAVRGLPARQQLWGRLWGTFGAVVLRVLFIGAVTWLLKVPLLQLVGGLALVWIAVKLVRPMGHAEGQVREGASLREAVKIIILADVVMSLDNVIAIAAFAAGDLVLVVFGLLLSLPLVIWGSGLLARLMNRFAWIIWVGGGVLGYVAAQMILDDPFVIQWLPASARRWHRLAPIALGLAIAALGWHFARKARRGEPVREHFDEA